MLMILSICLISLSLPIGLCEITNSAMSIAGMKELVDLEGFFISEMESYTAALKNKIDMMESLLQEVQSKREISRRNPEEFVSHPLNAFSLIRRLHEDWTQAELLMLNEVGLEHLQAIEIGLDEAHSTDNDLDDAIAGIIALQQFYNLQPSDIANGLLMGKQYNSSLTTLNCQALANACMNFNYDKYALNWFKAAVEHYNDDRDGQVYREVFDFRLPDLYINYTSALVTKGFRKAAWKVLQDVADLDATLWLLRKDIYEVGKIDVPDPTFITSPWFDVTGCLSVWQTSQHLSCHYEQNTSEFLRIAPLKVETLSLKPHIVLYHDVIYDSEISKVKNISLPSLKSPLRIIDAVDYNLKLAQIREDHQSPLSLRIKDMTGEDVKEDTDFQIDNYGICGFRNFHTDNIEMQDQTAELGDRLTSIMFFMNDVVQGGAFAFPNLNLTIWPQKGSALVWRNLDHRMQPNKDLLHVSCPVVVGSKWTLMKWLHERPQMFSRPCTTGRKFKSHDESMKLKALNK
ncbi:prolyl 4-hydroxylase subunit alpha-1 isoform X1 [Drosophila mauritiana]|uniref:Prolyl 4-hydroxylase subunit alpha-1 isoform X1 n=1 Tax=Drosophila mauritiana TaxID=7226 RepID=A0A6P8JU59_DROMA|nr:prolyl 4-hydroxylase subunit alpha-1 isoform X1 [Drosophila mauritiana]